MVRRLHAAQRRLTRLIALTLVVAQVHALHGAPWAGGTIAVHHNASEPRVAFAAAEIARALGDYGLPTMSGGLPRESAQQWQVSLDTGMPGTEGRLRLHSQGYAIVTEPLTRTVSVTGGATDGIMYGGLRLAEILRHNLLGRDDGPSNGVDDVTSPTGLLLQHPLSLVGNVSITSPLLELRGLKMNVPLDARTPSYGDAGDAAQHNIATMWDMSFWTTHLDQMAKHQYNLLSLWSLNPWPSLVDYSDGPYAGMSLSDVYRSDIDWVAKNRESMSCNDLVTPHVLENLVLVKRMSVQEKVQFWRDVMMYADNRGIKVMIVTWNIFAYPVLNNETSSQGINTSQTNLRTINWVRHSVNLTFATYPLLGAIATDPGEHMKSMKGNFSREEWVWRTYGMGMQDALDADPHRKIWMMVRQNQASITAIMKDFSPLLARITDFQLGYKYAHNAHMYGTTHPPYAKIDVLPKLPPGVKGLWNLRNDDIFNFRWGSPDYARRYYASMPLNVTAGMHMGSDGYVWARVWSDKNANTTVNGLEIEKHWYKFMIWGRCAYATCSDANSLGANFWTSEIATRLPGLAAYPGGGQAAAAMLYAGWAAASQIIPQVNRLVIGKWINDFQWNPEGCFNRDATPSGTGFVDVLKFGQYQPVLDSNILDVASYVQHKVNGQPITGISPVDVVNNLTLMVTGATTVANDLQQGIGTAIVPELNETLTDLLAVSSLGSYYADKLCGATELAMYKATNATVHKDTAISCLKDGVAHWDQYVQLASGQYRYPQLLGRVSLLDIQGFAVEVAADVTIAEAA